MAPARRRPCQIPCRGAPWQAGRCEDRGAIVRGDDARLTASAPGRLAGEALQDAADAIMRRRIGGALIAVCGADGGAARADGGGRGALLGALGKVGGDGQRIGWHRPVTVVGAPCRPPAPCRTVLRASVRGAGIAERIVNPRLVGGGDRSGGRGRGAGGGDRGVHRCPRGGVARCGDRRSERSGPRGRLAVPLGCGADAPRAAGPRGPARQAAEPAGARLVWSIAAVAGARYVTEPSAWARRRDGGLYRRPADQIRGWWVIARADLVGVDSRRW